MRNPDFSEADAAGIFATLMKKLIGKKFGAGIVPPEQKTPPHEQGLMSIVEVTEELLRQTGSRGRR